MTNYPFDMQLVVDPFNTSNVVANGQVFIYDPSDTANMSPLVLTDPNGLPLANPLISSSNGFLPAFIAAVPQVKWAGSGFVGFFDSYVGLRDVALEALAKLDGLAVGTVETVDALADAEASVTGDVSKVLNFKIPRGAAGMDGSNVLPTDTAIQQAIQDATSATRGALNATYASAAAVASKADKAKVDAISKQALPLREVTVSVRGTDPIACGSFDGYLWGTSAVATSAQLYRSSDGGNTWTTYGTNPVPIDGKLVAQGVQKMLKTSTGEVLAVSFGNVVLSTGWATGNPTWSVVLSNPTASYIYPWGFDGDGTKFIVVHYAGSGTATPDRADSRYGWISTDGGLTWTIKWDTAAIFGATENGLTHVHGAAYDPWEDRFFINEGHGTSTGVYVSYDNGNIWTKVPYGNTFDAAPANAPTVVMATDNGVVFGSDDAHNGIYVLPRGTNTIEHAWAWGGVQNSQLLGYALQAFRDPDTGIVYISYISDEADLPAPVGASDGRTANEVWREPGVFGMWRKLFIHNGKVLMWEQLSNLVAKGKLGGSGSRPVTDTGRTLGGLVTGGRKSLAVGAEAIAIGDASVAVGGGAGTTTHNGTAVGANAKVIGSGTSLGSGATSDALGLAAGYQATATGGLSVGSSALTASVSTTAIGRGARAATDAGGAVVNSTAVGRDAKANAASGNATAIGQAATASGARNVVVGSAASSTLADTVVIGDAASSTASSAVALGKSAVASHTNSLALGANTATTANDQVRLGARHIEYSELAADPVAPAVNNARVYTRDNGAGKTQLCVRFNTGAVMVIATEP